jgi:small subunit ribosomal protein S8e
MVISQAKSRRSLTGSRYVAFRKKKQYETGREATLTKVGTEKRKVLKVLGGNNKYVVLQTDVANVIDQKTKKAVKAKILSVKANPANANYIRRNIITKGCTIATDKGDVLVTSRPGQTGVINGYLI